jgi:hypothetical protein
VSNLLKFFTLTSGLFKLACKLARRKFGGWKEQEVIERQQCRWEERVVEQEKQLAKECLESISKRKKRGEETRIDRERRGYMERNGYSVEEIGRKREGEQSVVVELASRDWEVQRQLQVERRVVQVDKTW